MDGQKGLVFHVIRGSFVDGYGVRTTVFLKGCPLACVWCCNPEGQKRDREIKLTAARCDRCARCVPVCPAGAVRVDDGIFLDRQACTGCGRCVEACHTGALEWFGRYYSVDELFDLVRKDEQFYRSSGGGVTIGGGEPTLQAAFTLAFVRKCRDNFIHTALDTCGYTLSPEGMAALAEADLLLFDVKGLDATEHVRNTGVSNEIILANLKKLDALGRPIIVRVPVIPGYTDTGNAIKATAGFLASLRRVERVDLLAVHEYGKVKYGQLGLDYRLEARPLAPGRLEEVRALFAGYGLNVQLGG